MSECTQNIIYSIITIICLLVIALIKYFLGKKNIKKSHHEALIDLLTALDLKKKSSTKNLLEKSTPEDFK